MNCYHFVPNFVAKLYYIGSVCSKIEQPHFIHTWLRFKFMRLLYCAKGSFCKLPQISFNVLKDYLSPRKC